MKYIIFALILLTNSYATDFRDAYKGNIKLQVKDVPSEYQILIESINHYNLSKDDKDNLLSSVILSDTYFKVIPKKELFILSKMEIYKTILSYFKTSNFKSLRVDQKLINELSKISVENNDELYPFAKWILKAVIKDLKIIIKYKYYQTYLTQKAQNKPLQNIELLKLDRKITLLIPWIRTFKHSSPEEINLRLRSLHFKIVRRIAFLSKTIYQTTSFEELPKLSNLNNLTRFLYSRTLTPQESTLQKIDDVLGNIELFPSKEENNTSITNLPKPSDDWVPKDDTLPLKIKGDDLFPDPNPNYVKPENLPEPVNDWLLDI